MLRRNEFKNLWQRRRSGRATREQLARRRAKGPAKNNWRINKLRGLTEKVVRRKDSAGPTSAPSRSPSQCSPFLRPSRLTQLSILNNFSANFARDSLFSASRSTLPISFIPFISFARRQFRDNCPALANHRLTGETWPRDKADTFAIGRESFLKLPLLARKIKGRI